MPRNPFKETFVGGFGALHAYKAGTANSTAASVVAAVTGKKIRVKAFRFIMTQDNSGAAADVALNQAWLSDGASTPLIGLGVMPGVDVAGGALVMPPVVITDHVVPGEGVKGTAATALTIDFTVTASLLNYQLDVYYDLVDL